MASNGVVKGYHVSIPGIGILHVITSAEAKTEGEYEAEYFVWSDTLYRSGRLTVAKDDAADIASAEQRMREEAQRIVDEVASEKGNESKPLEEMAILACSYHAIASVNFAQHLQKIRADATNPQVKKEVERALNAANLFRVMND